MAGDDPLSSSSSSTPYSTLFAPPRPGRCVGDPEQMRTTRALMSIPTFTDPLAYITLMQSLVAEARDKWLAYKSAVAADYDVAYTEMKTTLGSVRKAMEERAKREEAIACFALNLLTVGVGGSLAGNAVKLGLKKLGAAEAFYDKAKEIAKEKISEPIAKATEWGYKQLGFEVEGDPFEPVGMTPHEFGQRMEATLLYQSATLQGSLSKIQMDGGYTLQGVKNLAQMIIPSPFIQTAPKDQIQPGDLKNKAALALWLAWAWGRDDNYWKLHGWNQYEDRSRNERDDFEPIRKKLVQIGVPPSVCSMKETRYLWMNNTEIVDRINMPDFLDWAGSTAWIQVMFNRSTPQDDVWVSKLPAQMAKVKVKKATAWMFAGAD